MVAPLRGTQMNKETKRTLEREKEEKEAKKKEGERRRRRRETNRNMHSFKDYSAFF